MISLYSGTPGSGKSLHMARDILRRLRRRDALVVTNFPFRPPDRGLLRPRGQLVCLDNSDLSPQRLEAIADVHLRHHPYREGLILLLLDECQVLFDARRWSAKDRRPWVTFFAQHRKLGFDVVLVAQFDAMIDRQIRSLIEYEVIHRRLDRYGAVGWLLCRLLGGVWVCAISRWYGARMRLGSEWIRAGRRLCQCYDTRKTFEEAHHDLLSVIRGPGQPPS